MPKVSVIIPNYNHARFLDQRIRSVLDQTYQDFEVIILDDASTDDSLVVIQKYAGDRRVAVVRNETNSSSVFRQWNKGVGLAKSEYIWIAESDDDASPLLLERLLKELEADADVVLSYCNSWVVDEKGIKLRKTDEWCDRLVPGRWSSDFVTEGSSECARFLIHCNTIHNASAVIFRRSSYITAGMADETMRMSGDWMTWVKIALQGKISYVAEPLNIFRRHANSVCAVTASVKRVEEAAQIRKFICSQLNLGASAKKAALKDLVDAWWSTVAQGPFVSPNDALQVGMLASCLWWSGFLRVTEVYLRGVFLRSSIRRSLVQFFRRSRQADHLPSRFE